MNAFLSKYLLGNPKSAMQTPKWLGLALISFVVVATAPDQR